MEVNINLIPESRKIQIARSRHMKLVIKTEVGISLLIIVLFIFIVAINNTLNINLGAEAINMELENNQSKYKEIHDYEENFKNINSSINEIAKIKKDQIYWSKLLFKLSENMTGGTELTDLATNNFTVSLVGKSERRDDLLAFKDALSKEDCFSDINLPLSDLVSQENISFELDFNVNENCLKNQ